MNGLFFFGFWAANIKVSMLILIFWLPKCGPYIGISEKVLTVAFVRCKPGLLKSHGVLIFSHCHSTIIIN